MNEIMVDIDSYEFTKTESNDQLLSCAPDPKSKLYIALDKVKKNIEKEIEHIYKHKIQRDIGISVLKYGEGSFIGMHRDWAPNDPYVKKFNKPRVDVGVVFYINDDYLGGDIMMFDVNEIESEIHYKDPYMTLKPNYGTCLIFDSCIYHMTKPIEKGEKYCMTIFYQLDI